MGESARDADVLIAADPSSRFDSVAVAFARINPEIRALIFIALRKIVMPTRSLSDIHRRVAFP